MINLNKNTAKNVIIIAIPVIGVILSLIQFLYNRSMWEDDAWLALNIINRNAFELLKPLDYYQVAPILFLEIEKLFSVIIPNSEYGLRLFPLLCYWASIYLFYKIVKKELNNTYAIIFALSIFCLGYSFIFFSNEIKQYISDVFVALLMFFLVLKEYKNNKNKYFIIAIVGAISILLSNVAPIILLSCGSILMYDLYKTKSKRGSYYYLSEIFALWLIVFAIYFYYFIYNHPSRVFMTTYWNGSFLPFNPFKLDFYIFLFKKVPLIIFSALFYINVQKLQTIVLVIILSGLHITGIVYLIRKRRFKLLFISCVPLLLHLLLSAFQLYPFDRRLIFYSLFGVIIVCSLGFYCILKNILKKWSIFAGIVSVSLFSFILFARFPIKYHEVRGCIEYIQGNMYESTNVYVFPVAAIIFKYYGDIGHVSKEINANTEMIEYWLDNTAAYLMHQDMDYTNDWQTLKGKNWLLISTMTEKEEIDIINRINSLGYKQIKEYRSTGASAYLYDFGN
jgi:hypothetical protein